MDQKKIKIRKDEIKRIKFLKNELLKIILKSIMHNNQIKPKYRAFAFYKINKKKTYLTQQKNYCMLTGRAKGVWSMWNISRHMINKYAKFGHLPNIKVNNEK